jgi:uncharacterized protein YdcH (DUF465 family)
MPWQWSDTLALSILRTFEEKNIFPIDLARWGLSDSFQKEIKKQNTFGFLKLFVNHTSTSDEIVSISTKPLDLKHHHFETKRKKKLDIKSTILKWTLKVTRWVFKHLDLTKICLLGSLWNIIYLLIFELNQLPAQYRNSKNSTSGRRHSSRRTLTAISLSQNRKPPAKHNSINTTICHRWHCHQL